MASLPNPAPPADDPAQLPANGKSDNVAALERGIAVLRCFTAEVKELSNAELSRKTGIPKATVTRLAVTLVRLGLLSQDSATDTFSLAAGVVSLSQAFLAGLDVRALARPHMRALAEETGGSVYLAVRDGLEMVLIEISRPRMSMISSTLDIGSRVPLANSALGRAYLGGIEPHEREQLIETLHLSRGSEWARLAPGLTRALNEAARLGYAGSYTEWHREVSSIAVPLVGASGEVMSLNCGGAAYWFTEERLHTEVAGRLLQTANTIAREIGGSVPRPAASLRPASPAG
ncbi:MAG: IclR family transcriptional regulator [Rhizobacter sp.]|nr:IclR family transcriptional regulator [Rhizobacter sp.]